MARAKNSVKTVSITVSATETIRDFLEELTDSGLYGKNAAETANVLIADRIRELIRLGELGNKPQGASGSLGEADS